MEQEYELVVIGAGAAGLSAAQYGARANLKTLLVEQLAAGGQALLVDNLENYPGVMGPVSGYQLAETMRQQAEGFGVKFHDAAVTALVKEGNGFAVSTTAGAIRARAVVLATGATHRHLGVPGEEEFAGKGVSYCATCDGPFFRGKPMVVVGGGDAACDEAMFLSKLASSILMVHRRDRFRAQGSIGKRVLDNPKIEVKFNTEVSKIEGNSKVEGVELVVAGKVSKINTNAVFIFVGSIPQSDLATEAKKDDAGYIITDEHMATSIAGLYAAGDVRACPFRQLVTAASDGAIAAHSIAKYLDEMSGAQY